MTSKAHSFYTYYNKTFKIVALPEGGLRGYLLNLATGDFELANHLIGKVRWATSESDIFKLDEEEFIVETEEERSTYLRGDGPIFALYETVDAVREQMKREKRWPTEDEAALIETLRRRTFKMWEEEFARRAAGEPPTFEYTSTMA